MIQPAQRRRLIAGIAGGAALAIVLTGCQSQRDSGDPATSDSAAPASDVDSTFVFGASSDPSGLDPAFASDGETFRISRQMFEGLVSAKPGTTEIEPLLATEWKASEDGKSYTFTLREGVKFSDGTDFNADAVIWNLERIFNKDSTQFEPGAVELLLNLRLARNLFLFRLPAAGQL